MTSIGEAAVAPDPGLRLDPADEYPHAVDDVVNFNESVYASGWNAATKMGGWMRLGNRVNEGYAELSVCLYLPDGRVVCQFKRPEISTNEGFEAGGLRYAVKEPFKGLEMEYEGELLVLDDPEDLRDPQKMFETAPRAEGHVRFDIRGVSPVHGGEAMTPEAEKLMYYGRGSPAGTSTSTPACAARSGSATRSSRSTTPTAGATTPGARATGRRSGPTAS